MDIRAIIRRAAAGAVATIFAMVVIGPGGDFFSELARENGAYISPTQRVKTVIDWFSAVVGSYPFGWVAGGVLGFAVGAWLDAVFKRKEAPADTTAEREALAARAHDLAARLSGAKAQLDSDSVLARAEDVARSMESKDYSGSDRQDRANARAAEKYGTAFEAEVLQVMYAAAKFVPIGPWRPRDIGDALEKLTRIEASLRDPRPNVVSRADYDRLDQKTRALREELKTLKPEPDRLSKDWKPG